MYFNTKSAATDQDKASLFNEFFHSVFVHSPDLLPSDFSLPPPTDILCDIEITIHDVFLGLSSLMPQKASGIDGIPARLLKLCATSLCQPVHHLFTQCFVQACLPSEWKLHKISPVYKNGSKNLVTNYRPISLLPCISKVLEKIIFNKMYDFIEQSYISNSQFGFLKSRSTLQQLLNFLSNIYESFSCSSQTDVVYLDIQKAFDSVPHGGLLSKLWSAGVTGSVWNFIRAYLSQRFQCVSINGSVSSYLPVVSGVPQGSILGPLLFIIYMNDLPASVHSSLTFLFADDSKCQKLIKSMNDCDLLQQDLDSIHSWSLSSQLSFNCDKSAVMSFCSAKRKPLIFPYSLNDCAITRCSTYKDLGVVFTPSLSWSTHISKIISKCYNLLHLIRRAFPHVSSTEAKRTLYITLILSRLSYCSPVWRPHTRKDIMALEKVQRRATKYILNYHSIDYKSRLKTLKLLPLSYRLELNDLMFFISSYKQPSNHFDIMNYFSFADNKSTRSSVHHKLKHTLPSSTLLQHSYFHRLPRLWNSIPSVDLN
jgi:hypothetical protein